MNKRLLAMFIAMLMLVSVFILSGCGNETEDRELTVKELFEVSLKNGLDGFKDYYEFTKTSGEGTIDLSVDKLTFGGMDLTQLGKISLTGNGLTDKDGNTNFKMEVSAFGEKLPVEYTFLNGEIFLVDMFGLNEKPIKFEMPEPTENEDGAVAGANNVLGSAEQVRAIIEHVINSLNTVIDANLNDSAFSAEDKDVTVLGTEYKNAKVITLTVDKVLLANIANGLIDELMKNDDIKAMFGEDFDKTEALKELDDFKSLRIINTVVDETSVALSAYIDVSVAKQSADESITVDESVSAEPEVEKEDKTFGIVSECANKNLSLEMGFVNEEGKVDAKIDGAIILKVTDDGSKFNMSFKVIDSEEELELISAKADITDGRYDGTVYLNGDTSKIEINFFAKGDKNEGEFGITGITLVNTDSEGNETKQEIPLEIAFDYKNEETKLTLNGEIKLSIEEAAEIEVSFNTVAEYKDVTIESVTDSVPMDEVDTEELMSAFPEKYPTIYSFVSLLGGTSSKPEKEENYFENEGMGLWLPDDFYETEFEDFTSVYTNDDIIIFVVKEGFGSFAGITDFDFDDYMDSLHLAALDNNPTKVQYDEYNTPYFEFVSEGYGYYLTMYEGNGAYWFIQFVCEESAYNDNKANFAEWAYYADPYADISDLQEDI